jgi:pimeloyl-ACP methyl ester carboxylesterase
MSYRQMLMQGIISEPPPFDPPIDGDPGREARRAKRLEWLGSLPEADPREKRIDYGRPLMRCGTEEKLREKLASIRTPTLILGGTGDPISTPELMTRTAGCLPHCKLVMYSNCGHNIDTDLTEELTEEADRFLRQTEKNGKWYTFRD